MNIRNLNIEHLPKDILFSIFIELSNADLFQMCMVDKYIHSILQVEHYWRMRCLKYMDEFDTLKRIYYPMDSHRKTYKEIKKNDEIYYKYGDGENGLQIDWYVHGKLFRKYYLSNKKCEGSYEKWRKGF